MPHGPELPPMTYAPQHHLSHDRNPRLNLAFSRHLHPPVANPESVIYNGHPSSTLLPSVRGHDSVISYPSPLAASYSSSAGSTTSLSGMQHGREQSGRPLGQKGESSTQQRQSMQFGRRSRDMDEESARLSIDPFSSPVPVIAANHTTITYSQEPPDEEEVLQGKALRILLYLSGLCSFISIINLLWALVSSLATLALQPLRFCSARSTFSQQIITFLSPPLNLQLAFIYSKSNLNGYSAWMLLLIHLMSPVVSIGVALAAWTAACFWIYTAILGDPSGNDGHNDGRDAVMAVRAWWERWLSRALR